jgi:hypothetical protein
MATSANPDNATKEQLMLRDLVRRHKVCWEVWPEEVVCNSHLEKIGFELELLGTPAEATSDVSPGSGACVEVYDALRKVADFLIPRDQSLLCRCEIEPFEPALRYSAVRKDRPDVVLGLKILHPHGLGPVDESELRCLQQLQNKLEAVGAYRGRWLPDPNCPSQKYRETARSRDRVVLQSSRFQDDMNLTLGYESDTPTSPEVHKQ